MYSKQRMYNKDLIQLIKELFEERLSCQDKSPWTVERIMSEYNAALAEACLEFIDSSQK
jgi:hypothetical protein